MDEYIKEKRPNISKSSVKTYSSILRNLYKKVFGDEEINFNNFEKSKDILKYLNDLEPNKRKTTLSALVVITDNKDYRNRMLEDIKEYNKEQNKQVKSDKQKENWVDGPDIEKIFEDYLNNAKVIYKKANISNTDLQEIQQFIILSLLSGIYIPPRRSKDYVDFKIRNINKDKDNYIDKNKLVFNSYKTAKTYGKQEVNIPKELKLILSKWIKINPTDYLLFDSSLNPLTNVKLNQRINKIFGKKVSVNQLRHTFLTDKYEPLIEMNKNLEETMKDMGSSRSQEKIYIKK